MRNFYFLLLFLIPFQVFPGIPHTNRSVLSEGSWWKIAVNETGIHKITYQDLKDLGINPSGLNPQYIRIFGNGGHMLSEANAAFREDDLREIAVKVVDNGDGRFDPEDYILFYATGTKGWIYNYQSSVFSHFNNFYADKSFYFITIDNRPGKRITDEQPPVSVPNFYSSAFTDLYLYEKDSVSLIKSGKYWFGDSFSTDKSSFSLDFNIPSIVPGSQIRITSSVVAKSNRISYFYINVDDAVRDTVKLDFVDLSSTSVFAKSKVSSAYAPVESGNFELKYVYSVPSVESLGWLDFSEVEVRRQLVWNGGQMSFRDPLSVAKNRITGFLIKNPPQNLMIWDVTDEGNVQNVTAQISDSGKWFKASTDTLREFVAFDGTVFYPVEKAGEVKNQNLHSLQPTTLVIVAPGMFASEAGRLASFHREKSGITAQVVDVDQIYNEFSSGKKDISAIRDFMKMLYDRADSLNKPKYLLLFGDGSYDPKNRVPGNNDIIPTFQSAESLKPIATYVSDDYFGIMADNAGSESNGKIDVGIGRFPVSTEEEAKIIVDKIINYSSASDTILSDWRNKFTFIADDENSNLHMHQAEELVQIVESQYPVYNINKIYLDAYKMVSTPAGDRLPDVNKAINKAVQEGTLVLNYTGHGGEDGWSAEKVLTLSDIGSWTNYEKLPVFVTATCEFSRFDNPERVTAGEMVLLQPKGGAIALYSTTRQALATSNFKLDTSFFRNLIPAPGAPKLTMGDLIRISKNRNNNNYTIRNFVLLGDPAQTIAFPEYDVVATKINGKDVSEIPDTLLGLSPVNVKGEIRYKNGGKVSSFNGKVFPKMFDKPTNNMTIGNTADSYPENFKTRNSLLYSGAAEVKNGDFEFSFVIPESVAQTLDGGKLSFYARNGTTDANGYDLKVITGGVNPDISHDMNGPEITLYMDTVTFRNGGVTGSDTRLLSFYNDPQGINFINLGLGHEIVMKLDGDNQQIVLNENFIPDSEKFGRGEAIYGFTNLKPGRHTVSVKAWDMYNNPSTAELVFYVHDSSEPVLTALAVRPNPFTDHVYFNYNSQPGSGQPEVKIVVWSVYGKRVAEISSLNTVAEWDGTGYNGEKLPAGVYLYTFTILNPDGTSGSCSGKLIKAE